MTQSVMAQTAQVSVKTADFHSPSRAKSYGGGFSTMMNNSLKETSRQTETHNSKSNTVKRNSQSDRLSNSSKEQAELQNTRKCSEVASESKEYRVREKNSAEYEKQNKAEANDNPEVKEEENNNAAAQDPVKAIDQTADKTEKSMKSGETQKKDAVQDDLSCENIDLVAMAAQLHELFKSIREEVAESLNLTPEELNVLLKSQGFDEKDLTSSDVLKQLVLKCNGKSEISDFLTDENLADTLKKLLDNVEALKKEAGDNYTEQQIKDILTAIGKAKEDATGNIADKNAGKATEETSGNNAEKTADTTADGETVPGGSEVLKSLSDKTQALSGKNEAAANTAAQITAADNKTLTEQTETSADSYGKIKIEVTKFGQAGQAGNQTKEGTGSNDPSEADTSRQFETFINNLAKNAQQPQIDASKAAAQLTQFREIVNQICEKIKILLKPEQTKMELTLNPESLGKVNLTVQSKNGTMTAQFVVQNEVTKEAIESQIQSLQEAFDKQGIKVETIEVAVSGYAFDHGSQSGTGEQPAEHTGTKKSQGSRISMDEAMAMEDVAQDENNMPDVTGIRGSQIDYTA